MTAGQLPASAIGAFIPASPQLALGKTPRAKHIFAEEENEEDEEEAIYFCPTGNSLSLGSKSFSWGKGAGNILLVAEARAHSYPTLLFFGEGMGGTWDKEHANADSQARIAQCGVRRGKGSFSRAPGKEVVNLAVSSADQRIPAHRPNGECFREFV